MPNILIYKIRNLYGKDDGAKEKYDQQGEIEIENTTVPLDFHITLMKMESAIVVMLRKINTEITFECGRCLKKFQKRIEIDWAEREFFFHKPKETQDREDLFLADLKLMQLDIQEMLRQEILLHFPVFPLCSSTCKGLCQVCGINKNEKNCGHTPKEAEQGKPLENIKNIIT